MDVLFDISIYVVGDAAFHIQNWENFRDDMRSFADTCGSVVLWRGQLGERHSRNRLRSLLFGVFDGDDDLPISGEMQQVR